MDSKKIAVLGAGHAGYGLAADMTLAGHEVRLFEGIFTENLRPVIEKGDNHKADNSRGKADGNRFGIPDRLIASQHPVQRRPGPKSDQGQ